ncbi:RQC-minor-2 family DNA-binding protein [Halobacillus seohaensis]|uniref:RQC-minor-2 family DNA-binding protein n=1 Tax=Halobacillus seohaensis TaxID=447421 RepID=A0ABW2EM17_9BACI
MGLPASLTYHDERYPYITFTPIGKKNKNVRSIGHKFERGILSRLNETISDYVTEREMDVVALQSFLNIGEKEILPVSFLKDDTLHPYLIKPEFFLWKSHSENDGLPFSSDYMYETDFTRLSSDELEQHIRHVVDDYMFLAEISFKERREWLDHIISAFHKHPIVELTHKKKDIITAIETMNQSALLSLIKYPEDISFWRHRVEIVMRPFRALPQQWLVNQTATCMHDKKLQFCSIEQSLCCSCEICDIQMFYFTKSEEVFFEEEFDVDRAFKRVDTIHRQFNEVADQNADLLQQLRQLSFLKSELTPAQTKLDKAMHIAQLIERYRSDEQLIYRYPLLEMYEKLSLSHLPIESFESNLVWLSQVELADVTMVKQVEGWLKNIPDELDIALDKLLAELNQRLDEVVYQEDDIIITVKGRSLDYASTQQMLDLIHYYGTDYPAHTLVQVLAGKSTNKLRRLHLHETRWFGLLSDWPEKYIQRLFNQLEKQGWLTKQQKGYSISPFAEEVM